MGAIVGRLNRVGVLADVAYDLKTSSQPEAV